VLALKTLSHYGHADTVDLGVALLERLASLPEPELFQTVKGCLTYHFAMRGKPLPPRVEAMKPAPAR